MSGALACRSCGEPFLRSIVDSNTLCERCRYDISPVRRYRCNMRKWSGERCTLEAGHEGEHRG